MKAELQEAISKLPVLHKAHINEPTIENVAEISFRAGYDEGKIENAETYFDSGFDAGKQSGRKEVMEWINSRLIDPRVTGYLRVAATLEDWQAQLKKGSGMADDEFDLK